MSPLITSRVLLMSNPTHRVTAVFFDLDGTLLDTAPDLADALNQLLNKHGRDPLPLKVIRPTVAQGTRGILANGFSINQTDPRFNPLRDEFLSIYQSCLTNKTTYFDGMAEVLEYLDVHAIPWGVVTNKPGWLARPLLNHFKLTRRYRCLISGDQLANRKPHPEPLLFACKTVDVQPHTALYVGDTEGDIQAAKAAGMLAVAATYGYLSANSTPQDWKADALIKSPLELIDWLKGKENT
ncbi:Phosphoglycolate phosphatase [Coxiella burnetii str. Namibia]|nr:Phosphoglycolate phosphatase [Coxiella burnetii str. Namibia]